MLNKNNRTQNNQALISYEEIELIINKMGLDEFTVLDFYDYIKDNERDFWERLNLSFMNSGNKKGYSPLNHISTRLVQYSKQKDSCLQPHISYEKDENICFRKVTDAEKKRFKSDNIAVFRVKDETL